MQRGKESRRRHAERGFSYLEVICSVVILALALLGHASTTITEQQMGQVSQARSEALLAARQFVERMRADDDFAGLLSRIAALQLTKVGTGATTLKDGRVAFSPSAYYPDFVPPGGLASLTVRVEVPVQVGAQVVLREDVDLPYFGLPADLNGDGAIDAEPHDADYRALPVAFYFRWAVTGKAPAELRLSTWLRGRR